MFFLFFSFFWSQFFSLLFHLYFKCFFSLLLLLVPLLWLDLVFFVFILGQLWISDTLVLKVREREGEGEREKERERNVQKKFSHIDTTCKFDKTDNLKFVFFFSFCFIIFGVFLLVWWSKTVLLLKWTEVTTLTLETILYFLTVFFSSSFEPLW